MIHMEPNDNFDDFDTQIQSDELIPDGYEDELDAHECAELDNDAYGNDADGDIHEDDFPF
jgi:hypothetical protein